MEDQNTTFGHELVLGETALYGELEKILALAYKDVVHGKGKERHAEYNVPWTEQVMVRTGLAFGSNHFQLGQAWKKIQESLRMEPEKAEKELLHAINYLAAAIYILRNT